MKANFKNLRAKALKRGIDLKRIDDKTVKYCGYKTGFLAVDIKTGKMHRWSNLRDFQLNVIDLGREVDGWARR